MMGGYMVMSLEIRGTQEQSADNAFLTSLSPIPLLMTGADALQISRNYYFSNLLRISPNLTPRALAILAQVKMVGMRLWLSMKLIAGRLTPTFSARVSCDKPCSLRIRANSLTTFSISDSDDLSLMGAIIADLLKLLNVTIVTKLNGAKK